MTSTLFDKAAYDAGIRDAMDKVIDEWTFRYPGIDDGRPRLLLQRHDRAAGDHQGHTWTRPTSSDGHFAEPARCSTALRWM